MLAHLTSVKTCIIETVQKSRSNFHADRTVLRKLNWFCIHITLNVPGTIQDSDKRVGVQIRLRIRHSCHASHY